MTKERLLEIGNDLLNKGTVFADLFKSYCLEIKEVSDEEIVELSKDEDVKELADKLAVLFEDLNIN